MRLAAFALLLVAACSQESAKLEAAHQVDLVAVTPATLDTPMPPVSQRVPKHKAASLVAQ